MPTERPSLVFPAALLALAAGCGARSDLPTSADACPASSNVPLALAGEALSTAAPKDWDLLPDALAVARNAVYWSTTVSSPEPVPGEAGAILRIPIGSSDAGEPFVSPVLGDTVYDRGALANDGTYLYFPKRAADASGAFPGVVAKPLAGGRAIEIPNPPLDGGSVRAMATNNGRGVYWLLGNIDSSDLTLLVYWDGIATTTVARIPVYAFDLVVSADTAFILGNTEPVHPTVQTLFLVPLSSGTPLPVQPMPLDVAFLGSNRAAFFFSTLSHAGTIVRHDYRSGLETTLTAGAMIVGSPSLNRPIAFVDDDWVYYGRTHEDPSMDGNLWRVSVEGGTPEMISNDPSQTIGAVAADACNVYWLAQSAKEAPRRVDLMVRSKD